MNDLRLTTFAIDLVNFFSEAVTIILISEIIVNIKTIFRSLTSLFHPEDKIYPFANRFRSLLAFYHLP